MALPGKLETVEAVEWVLVVADEVEWEWEIEAGLLMLRRAEKQLILVGEGMLLTC